jgi:hypothetical protein
MDQDTKQFFTYQIIALSWFLSFAFMILVYIWTLLSHQEINRRKGPGFNLKEF